MSEREREIEREEKQREREPVNITSLVPLIVMDTDTDSLIFYSTFVCIFFV